MSGAGPDSRAELVRRRLAAARDRAAGGAIPRREGDRPVPLTPAQERLWILDRLAPGAAAYHVARTVHLAGALDEAALAQALIGVDERHEALRLRPFEDAEGRPLLAPSPAAPPRLARIDLAALPPARRPAVADRAARELGRRRFDPGRDPRLWRAALIRLGGDRRRLTLCFHHLALDGWSLPILFRELSHLYRRGLGEPLAPLPPLPIDFSDYAEWERTALAGPGLAREAAYWAERLAGLEPLELRPDPPAPGGRARRPGGALRQRRIPPAATTALERVARERGAGLFALLATAWLVVLGRLAGRRDVAVGFPVANRPRSETEGLIGFFVNTLVLRTDLGGDPALGALADRVQAATLEAIDHQRLPFAWLVQQLAPERSAGRAPLVRALIALQNAPAAGEAGAAPGEIDLPEVSAEIEIVDRGTADADLTLSIEPRDGGLEAVLLYRRERFAPTTAERLLRELERVLAALAERPNERLAGLGLGAVEAHRTLVEWNDAGAAYPRDTTIGELFLHQARRRADAIAVAWDGGALSYGELAARARRLAGALARSGAGLGSRVAVALPRGPEMVIAQLAALEAGAAYAPVDLSYPAERQAWMAADLAPAAVIGRHGDLDGSPWEALPRVDPDQARREPADVPRAPACPAGAGDPAYVMYTSGSTGRPKGVVVPHRAVARLVLGSRFAAWGEDEVWLQAAAPGFDAATLEVWGALLHGGRLALAPAAAPSPAELGALLRRQQITSLWLTAGLFHLMVDHEPAALGRLRQLLAGGDVLSPGHVARLAAAFPGLRLVNGYGPTENTTFTCCHRIGAELRENAGAVPIGTPVANTRVELLDPAGEPVPAGAEGELVTGGDGVAIGYLGRPRATAERFVPDPRGGAGARRYRTGDLARRRPDGAVEFLGRRDGQVKVRGFRVEAGEVEAAVAAHPAVARCGVVAAGPPSERRLAAVWVARDGTEAPEPAELRRFLADRLPEFMVPSLLLRCDSLPLGAHGKVDRRELLRLAEEALAGTDAGGGAETATGAEPRNELEARLAALWAEVLDRPAVGVHDDFFELGGHSLLAARVIARVRGEIGVELPLAALFENPTVAGLAAIAGAGDAAGEGDAAETAIEGTPPAAPPLEPSAPYRPPRDRTETWLAETWAEVLGRPRVGVDDDFFELGGHSLLAARIVARVRERLGVDLPLAALFESPTVAGLAAAAERADPRPPTPPPERIERAPLPLSYPQQRLWFLHRLEPGGAAYNVPLALRLTGPLDHRALERALTEIEHRHEVLRTTFGDDGGEPVQRVHPPAPRPLALADLGHLPAPERAAATAAAAVARRPFDLERGPVWRALLLRLGERDHRLILAQHHVVSDGWSLGVLCRELSALYGAFAAGRPSPLPPLPFQYGDYALEQRRPESQAAWRRQLVWWRRLDGLEPLELPADRPARGAGAPAGRVVRFALSRVPPLGLEALGRRRGATVFMAVAAAFQVVLARHAGQRRFGLGVPVAGRSRSELETLIGFFVNTVVLRADLAGDPPFEQLLAAVRAETLAAMANQDVPFERVVEELRPERALGRTPFFQVALTFRGGSIAEPMAGLEVELIGLHGGQAAFDMTLSVGPGEGPGGAERLDALIEYDAARFDRTTVLRLARDLESVLAAAAADPARRLSSLPQASAAERHQVLVEWARPARDAAGGSRSSGVSVGAAIAAVARQRPDAVALRGATPAAGGSRPEWALSYGELVRRTGRLARRLAAAGVGPEVRVGLWMERGAELVVSLLAVLEAGGAFVTLDPALPRERLDWIAADAGLELVLTHGHPREAAPGGVRALDLAAAFESAAADASGRDPLPSGHDGDAGRGRLAYVLYTSGSTGRPKGVGVPAGALAAHCAQAAAALGLGPGDRVVQSASFAFDVALEQLLPALTLGAEVALAEDLPWGAAELASAVERLEATVIDLPTGLWREWLEFASEPAPALRLVSVGGEAMPAAPAAAWGRSPLAGTRLVNAYGPTEATITASLETAAAAARRGAGAGAGAGRGAGASVPIGKPLGGRTLHVTGRRGEALPSGAAGELAIGGELLARGYLGRPAATAERFVPDPSSAAGGRLYRTGDRVRWLADGRLAFLGRLDDQVKLRGFRIEPGEIERTLAEHPAVAECAVGLARRAAGGGDAPPRLTAWAAAAAGAVLDPGEVRAFVAARLPAYMVPEGLVVLPALPRLPGGKIDRRALPAPAASGGDGPAPRSGMERRLAALWSDLLGLERVALHDSFFDLGGSSILLMRLQSRLRAELGIEASLVELFDHPTVASLAARLAPAEPVERAQPAPRRGTREAPGAADPAGTGDAVAVLAAAGRFPGADGIDRLWQLLREGREAIHTFGREELLAAGAAPELIDDPAYVPARGKVDGIDLFDAAFFHVSPRDAELMDPQQRMLLELAWEALESAGYPPGRSARRVGVFTGAGTSRYFLLHLYPDAALMRAVGFHQVLSLNEKDTLPTFLSYKLNLSGPSVAVQTACSTSLVAVHMARRSLLAGECDLALAGGVTLAMPGEGGYPYRAGGILSPDGRCRAFAAGAAGTVPGAGAGLVVLKRLREAIADRDPIVALLRGTAINNDGAHKVGFTAPSAEGQAAVIAAALAEAGVEPATIGYLEGHGTGTVLGDSIELAALGRAFAGAPPGSCALGSIKANLGHLDAAAGIAGLIKAALALHRREIPPAPHAGAPNPELAAAGSPFRLPARAEPWPASATPRRAGVSSFGVGGTNAHAVLEEAPPEAEAAPEPTESGRPWQLLVLSARSAAALDAAGERLAGHLEHPDSAAAPALADVAFTLQAGRRAFAHRRFAVCRDRTEAVAALRSGDRRRLEGAVVPRWEEETPTVAFLFPGQGAQAPGMGEGLYRTEPVFRAEVDRCAELLAPRLGLDLRTLLYPAAGADPDAAARRLADTAVAQPALFTTSWALARLWISWGIEPDALAGHSLGEYVAACLAGVFELEPALELVAERGRLMAALPPGAMLAVRLGEDELAADLAGDAELALATVNEPGSAVVAGRAPAVERLAGRLRARGVACRPLEVSHAFHSPMMEPAVQPFRRRVEAAAPAAPKRPMIEGRTGDWWTAASATDPAAWAAQLRAPVRWSDAVARLAAESARVLLEVGPGTTLTALVRRHPAVGRGRPVVASLAAAGADCEPVELARALGRLWLAGVEPDWSAVHAPEKRRRIHLPTYPFERRSFWIPAPGAIALDAPAATAAEALRDGLEPRAGGGHERPELGTGFVAPRDPLERTVAEVWGEFLGVREVGVEDDFLELGGDSLLATQVMARLRGETGVELPVAALLAARTVAALAAALAEARDSTGTASDPLAEALEAIEGLSEHEVDALLREGEAK